MLVISNSSRGRMRAELWRFKVSGLFPTFSYMFLLVFLPTCFPTFSCLFSYLLLPCPIFPAFSCIFLPLHIFPTVSYISLFVPVFSNLLLHVHNMFSLGICRFSDFLWMQQTKMLEQTLKPR